MKNILKCLEGMEINNTDKVLIQLWGNSDSIDYLNAFEKEANKYSDYVKIHHHSKVDYSMKFDAENAIDEVDFTFFEDVDVVIDLMAESIAPSKTFSEKAVNNYRLYMGGIFKRLMQAPTFVQLRLPTKEMSMSFGLDEKRYYDVLNKGLDIDYKKVKLTGEELIRQFANSKEFVIETGIEKLVIRVDDRPWHNDYGNGDIPCGEVYTPCIETSANGSILIEQTKIMGKIFKNLLLTFRNGLLVESNQTEFLKCFNDMNEDSRRIGELGFGTNEGLSEVINCPLLDEKISGTTHIALGRNTMFGGENEGDIHHDLVFKPTRITLDGKTIAL